MQKVPPPPKKKKKVGEFIKLKTTKKPKQQK